MTPPARLTARHLDGEPTVWPASVVSLERPAAVASVGAATEPSLESSVEPATELTDGMERARDAEASETLRLREIVGLADSLSHLDPARGMDRAAELVARTLADWCVIDRLDAENAISRVALAANGMLRPDAHIRLRHLPPLTLDSAQSLAQVLSGASSEMLVEFPQTGVARPFVDALDEAQAGLFDDLGVRHAVVLPLVSTTGVVLGALTCCRRDVDARFSEADLLMVRLFGLRISEWMEALRQRELRQRAALVMQRSLLTALPRPDGIELGARYQPAGEALEVGGDWYDAVVSYEGHPVLMIGDVSGHDVSASVRMAQLRSMTRFAALERPLDPAAVLRSVDRAMPTLGISGTATLVAGAIVREDDRFRFVWSNAGHLPPLLIHADGRAELLVRPPDVLLGVAPGSRRNHAEEVTAGSTLVLYTDGLVERRDEPITAGLRRLVTVAESLAGEPLNVLCDRLVNELTPGASSSDDVALVAARLSG